MAEIRQEAFRTITTTKSICTVGTFNKQRLRAVEPWCPVCPPSLTQRASCVIWALLGYVTLPLTVLPQHLSPSGNLPLHQSSPKYHPADGSCLGAFHTEVTPQLSKSIWQWDCSKQCEQQCILKFCSIS